MGKIQNFYIQCFFSRKKTGKGELSDYLLFVNWFDGDRIADRISSRLKHSGDDVTLSNIRIDSPPDLSGYDLIGLGKSHLLLFDPH